MNKDTSLVSVIIPTYKNRGGLQASIDSVLNQSYRNIEIIVVDDNDPDSESRIFTTNIISEYSENSKVRYICHDNNKNGAAARNTGIRACKGDFIAFLDDDDVFLPEKIMKQMLFLDEHPEYEAVYTFVKINGKKIYSIPYEGDALIPLLSERTRMFTSSLLFRRHAIDAINGFDESFRRHQDYELMVKFFSHGLKVGCLQEYLIDYCKLGGNNLKGLKLEDIKKQYLSQFDYIINELEKENKGTKNKIIVSNYASVFVSHLANKLYFRAFKLFCKYFFLSPSAFLSYMKFFWISHLKKEQ